MTVDGGLINQNGVNRCQVGFFFWFRKATKRGDDDGEEFHAFIKIQACFVSGFYGQLNFQPNLNERIDRQSIDNLIGFIQRASRTIH